MNKANIIAWAAMLAAAYLAAVGATTFVEQLTIGPVTPALLAAVAAVWLFARERDYDFVVVAGLGLLVDLTAPAFIGLSTMTFLLVGFTVNCMPRHWLTRILPGQLLATLGLVWFVTQADVCCWLWSNAEQTSATTALWQPLAVAAYTTALTVPTWLIVGWIAEYRAKPTIATPSQEVKAPSSLAA